MSRKNFILRIVLAFFFFLVGLFYVSCLKPAYAQEIELSQEQLLEIGKNIFRNECAGNDENLIMWNEGEGFASLGIGHFLWYPEGAQDPFVEKFPLLLAFFKDKGISLPVWLQDAPAVVCPWKSREEFLAEGQSERMQSLHNLLKQTKSLQAEFLVQRLKLALPAMIVTAPEEKRGHIERQFWRIARSPGGWYALVDYVNFKGEGIRSSERYNGLGWGLMQVLEEMNEEAAGGMPLKEFSRAADFILTRRVENSPVQRNENRWLPGWKKRVGSYAGETGTSPPVVSTAKKSNVEAQLIAEESSVLSGKSLMVGLRLKMDEGWHTYWENPGDSGMATKITWELPEGFKAGAIEWPFPKKFQYEVAAGYGFDSEVLLLNEITAPEKLPAGRPVIFRASIKWLSCNEICVPGSADLALELPVTASMPQKDERYAGLFEAAKQNLPVHESFWQVKAVDVKGNLRIILSAPKNKKISLAQLEFFPREGDLIDHVAAQTLKVLKGNSGAYELIIHKSSIAPERIEYLEGVLVGQEGWLGEGAQRALAVDIRVEGKN